MGAEGAGLVARYQRRQRCRVCGGGEVEIFLQMGPMPLANALVEPGDAGGDDAFPLDVGLCPTCKLVQTPDVVDPGSLFTDYPYLTGVSATMRRHFEAYAEAVCQRLGLKPGALVVEVGSNDGSLLAALQGLGVKTVGVDPAANVAAIARDRGVETEVALFDQGVADRLRGRLGGASVVIANNVLAHVDEPVDFLLAAASLLKEGGAVVVEVPHLAGLIEATAWDTIYHEHLSYFSLTSLMALAEAAGLGVVAVERSAVHGGSMRAWLGVGAPHGQGPRDAREAEARGGLHSLVNLAAFAGRVAASAGAIHAYVEAATAAGRRVVGYGAAAKATVLINRAGLGTELVPWVVDANPVKVGRAIPGARTPIVAADALVKERPDEVLVFAWNLIAEIAEQQQTFVSQGGRLLLPLPSPHAFT